MILERLTGAVRGLLLMAAAAIFASLAAPAQASDCTLADQIRSANTNTAVGFCPAGTSHDVIAITQDITLTEALPTITGTITIEGGGHAISGDGKYRIFDVSGGNFTIKNVTLAKAKADYGSAIRARNGARAVIANVTFSDNTARSGGAVVSQDDDVSLSVSASDFRDNSAGDGGAITIARCSVEVSGSNFVRNTATRRGGAIYALGGTLDVENSTFVENIARTGGAVLVGGGSATLTHVTILAGSYPAVQGEGLHNQFGRLRLRNSIVVGNWAAVEDCSGDLVEASGNLIQDWTCGAEIGGNPNLAYPGDLAPLDGSPALDAGDPRYCLGRR